MDEEKFEEYRKYLSDTAMTEEQKEEYIKLLHGMVDSYVRSIFYSEEAKKALENRPKDATIH